MNHLLILGCGWLGEAVARAALPLYENITGTRTSKEGLEALSVLGINRAVFSLGDPLPAQAENAKAVVVAIPPSKITNYAKRLHQLIVALQTAPQSPHLVFVSSTGYYPATGNYSEQTTFTEAPSSPLVYEAEQILAQQTRLKTTVLRMGGLFNTTDRHPGNWFRGKSQVSDGYANMIHQTDAAHSVCFALANQIQGTFNVVSPKPVRKSDFYMAAFQHAQRSDIPSFVTGKPGKWIDGSLWETQGFQFTYPEATAAFKA